MNNSQCDLNFLFVRGKFEQIKNDAENAWLNGDDADVNPYNQIIQNTEYWCWYHRWQECNKYC